jgi:hypothetical protein
MTNMTVNNNDELKHRILARKLELESRLEGFKADSAGKAADIKKAIQKDLDELESKLAHGWDDLNENVVKSLNEWFKHTEPR